MKYKGLDAATVPAIERYLVREIKRMAELCKKRKRRPTAVEHAMRGILLGEKFGYQNLLGQIRTARRRA